MKSLSWLIAGIRNWKTTAGGFVIILSALVAFAKAASDNDPSTVPDIMALITAIGAGLAAIFARDADTTSAQSGAE